MPPDVRKEYDVALETLRKSGGEEILSVLQRDMGVSGTHIKATFREIVVNGKKYDSVDAMPPDVRRTYEQAMARVASGGAAVKPPVARAARAIRPPPSEDVEPRSGGGPAPPLFFSGGAPRGGGGGSPRAPPPPQKKKPHAPTEENNPP